MNFSHAARLFLERSRAGSLRGVLCGLLESTHGVEETEGGSQKGLHSGIVRWCGS